MSHHFDTQLAQADGRLDLSDLYIFSGEGAGMTVLILTVNPLAGAVSPTTFHPDGLYEFKVDTNDDAFAEISYRVTFSSPDAAGQQRLELRRAEGKTAQSGREGRLLARGQTGVAVALEDGGRLWAGMAADPFFGNGEGLDRFNQALAHHQFDAHAFDNAENAFHQRNSSAIVLELPSAAFGNERIHVWTTTSLWHPEEQVQINRMATPLLLHLFHSDEALKQAHDSGQPSDDLGRSGAHVAERVAHAVRLAGTPVEPISYGETVARQLLPDRLAYDTNEPATFATIRRNGRPLAEDAMDAVLSLLIGRPFSDQVGEEGRYQVQFPYLAPPV